MDWLQSLLWDPSSVAHIVFLYAFVVAAGVYLGKIRYSEYLWESLLFCLPAS